MGETSVTYLTRAAVAGFSEPNDSNVDYVVIDREPFTTYQVVAKVLDA